MDTFFNALLLFHCCDTICSIVFVHTHTQSGSFCVLYFYKYFISILWLLLCRKSLSPSHALLNELFWTCLNSYRDIYKVAYNALTFNCCTLYICHMYVWDFDGTIQLLKVIRRESINCVLLRFHAKHSEIEIELKSGANEKTIKKVHFII
jgi:hypothetical protein